MFHQSLASELELDEPTNHSAQVQNRHSVGGIPSALRDSPYCTSPIRPIPSFRSVSTRKSIRSTNRSTRPHSPARSTLGSLRLTSPYSESIFSLQSLTSTKSKSALHGRQQPSSRSVLLPHEVDGIAKLLGAAHVLNHEKSSGKDIDNGDDEYNLSDFDDDSTVGSKSALSIGDEDVIEHLVKCNNDTNLGNYMLSTFSNLTKDEHRSPQNESSEIPKSPHEQATREIHGIKLPSVSIDVGRGDTSPSRKKRGKNSASRKRDNPKIFNSPYAIQTNGKKLKQREANLKKASMVF